MTFYVITFCNNWDFMPFWFTKAWFFVAEMGYLNNWESTQTLFIFSLFDLLFGSYFDHLHRWWSWRTSSLTAQALCWCLSTCCQICQKSFGIPSVLSPHPRSKVTWWCCWKEWLSATRTPSCTGWDCAPDAIYICLSLWSVLYTVCASHVFVCRIWSLRIF